VVSGSASPDLASALHELRTPLHEQMAAKRVSQSQLARQVLCDRSRISRALSGREVPSRELVERIAGQLGVGVGETRRRWQEVDRIRRRARGEGGPPEDLCSYADLIGALSHLIQGRDLSHRELIRRDRSHTLRRSTVGAVLRGQRSASRDVVSAIVRACGVDDPVCQAAWDDAWQRLGRSHRQEQHDRQVSGYRQRRYMQASSWEIWRWR
jgi:transcriptional regulator with XRE-family HTH domain